MAGSSVGWCGMVWDGKNWAKVVFLTGRLCPSLGDGLWKDSKVLEANGLAI